MDPENFKSIQQWSTPKTVKTIQSFLGFGNFYRRFMKRYSETVNPLTKLTKKDETFKWEDEQEKAFITLKEYFT